MYIRENEVPIPYSQEPATCHVMTQINPLYNLQSRSCNLRFNNASPSTPRSSKGSFYPVRLYLIPQAYGMARPTHGTLFNYYNN